MSSEQPENETETVGQQPPQQQQQQQQPPPPQQQQQQPPPQQQQGEVNGKAKHESNSSRKERPQKRGGGGGRFEPYGNVNKRYRVFVSNIPYDVKWQALKDLMKEKGLCCC